jgi:hypothetical protein
VKKKYVKNPVLNGAMSLWFVVWVGACGGAPLMETDAKNSPVETPPQNLETTETSTVDAENACIGQALDFDEIQSVCALEVDKAEKVPSETQLRLSVVPENPTVVSGGTLQVALKMENVTSEALTIDITNCCFNFETAILQNGERVDIVTECGGLCGNCPPAARVTLLPGGSIVKHVEIDSTQTVIESSNMMCTPREPVLLKAGEYTVRISSPFKDARSRDNYLIMRKAETTLQITSP